MVETHPGPAALVAVADALQADDIVVAGAKLGVDAFQTELGRLVEPAQLRRANGDRGLNKNPVEVDFDAIAPGGRIGGVVEIQGIEREGDAIGRQQRLGQVEVITHVVIPTCEGALGGLLVEINEADRRVVAIKADHTLDGIGIVTSEVIIVIGATVHRGAYRIAWQRIDRAIFLDEAGRWATACADWPAVIVDANGPE